MSSEEEESGSEEGREDREKLLQETILLATNYKNQLQYAEAGVLYLRAAERLCDLAGDIASVLEFILSACSAFIDAGLPEEAKATLQQWDFPAEDYQSKLKFDNTLASVLIILGDSTAESKILSTIEMISTKEGADSLAIAQQYMSLSRLHQKLKDYAQSEQDCRSALQIFEKLPKSSSLSKEHLEAYLQLQKTYILQGCAEKALDLEKEIEQQCELENITYNWHLTHVAIAMVESDNHMYAEQLWKGILDRFSPLTKFQFSTEYRRIHSLVANSINELSVMYYNHAQQDKWQTYATLIRDNRWNLSTGSKCFETHLSRVSLSVFEQDWNVFFNIVLKLKEAVKVGMWVEIEIKFPDGEDKIYKQEIENPYVLSFKSEPLKKLEFTVYEAYVKLYEDSTLQKLLFTHVQHIPCHYVVNNNLTVEQLIAMCENDK